MIKERTHELAGKNVANKILVFPSGKASSVVQIDGLFKLKQNNLAQKAMIVKDIETVLVVGAFIARIPLVDKLAIDPFEIHTGDLVKVDADGETVMITKQRK